MDQSFPNYSPSKISFVSEITSLYFTLRLSWESLHPAVGVGFGDCPRTGLRGQEDHPGAHPCLAGQTRAVEGLGLFAAPRPARSFE